MTEIPEYDRIVGERLRDVRLQALVKQSELASAVGVQRAAVTRWEQGTRGLSVAMLLTLAEQLNVPAATLLPSEHQLSSVAAPTSSPAASSHDQAIASIMHVLHLRPDLIADLMLFLEQRVETIDATDVVLSQ